MRTNVWKIAPAFAMAVFAGSIAAACSTDLPGESEHARADGVSPNVVVTESGSVRGSVYDGALAFRGIRYAAPPKGPLRWKPPQPPEPWEGVREATSWPKRCIQLAPGNHVIGKEDCLFLNVWRPAKTTSSPLPVLVFLHGGSNVSGASSDSWFGVKVYDGAYVAAHGPAVVVTINYRLGAMGFLAHPAFSDEAADGASLSTNFGLMDQIAALEWVQRNIAAFGGDPERVLLFGQSAGAFDTCNLLTSPLAAGLFSRAMMMSGGCGADVPEGAAWGANRVVEKVGCEAAEDLKACLRDASPAAITKAIGYWTVVSGAVFGAVIDGYVVPDDPLSRIRAGEHHHVPLIVGTARDEMANFIWAVIDEAVETDLQYRSALYSIYGNWGEAVYEQYPVSLYGSPMAALEAALGDDVFVCPSRRAARAAAEHQNEPVYRYVFEHAFEDAKLHPSGAAHGHDVFFALHNLGGQVIHATQPERGLGELMSGALVRFAATGDPNGGPGVEWPAYEPLTHRHMVFDTPMTLSSNDSSLVCQFWDDAPLPTPE